MTDVTAATALPTRRHLVITGTGRAGTTFLVELLTQLGLDTGFTPAHLDAHRDPTARAGLEWDIRRDDAPYVVKSPKFIECAAEVLADPAIGIDHVLVPVRPLDEAAESRRRVERLGRSGWRGARRGLGQASSPVAGGLWGTRSLRRGDQEAVLADRLAMLVLALADSFLPVTFLRYPRLVVDDVYLFEKLAPVVPGLLHDELVRAVDRARRDAPGGGGEP